MDSSRSQRPRLGVRADCAVLLHTDPEQALRGGTTADDAPEGRERSEGVQQLLQAAEQHRLLQGDGGTAGTGKRSLSHSPKESH